MYKLFFILIALLAIFAGLLLGTLNADPVMLDLLWVQLNWPLGLVTVMALALGIIFGLAATWVLQVWPLRMALRRTTAAHEKALISQASAPSPVATVDDPHD